MTFLLSTFCFPFIALKISLVQHKTLEIEKAASQGGNTYRFVYVKLHQAGTL